MFKNIIEDIKMYKYPSEIGFLRKCFYLIFTQELHAVLIYRFGQWAIYGCKVSIISHICRLGCFFLNKFSEIIFGIWISPRAEIGPGLKIEHSGGVIIVGKLGRQCRISHQVTIGHIGGFKGGGVPTLGDNVYVGAGAKILGDITIGNNVKIGANAVVITDVPDNAIAVGVPAKVKFPKQNSQ